VLCGVFFLLIKSTTDPNSAITTAKAIASTVPELRNASTELACEVTEDELSDVMDVMEVGRIICVAVMLEKLVVLLVVLLGLAVLLIKNVDAGKLSSTVA
jgi:hypothetical protein